MEDLLMNKNGHNDIPCKAPPSIAAAGVVAAVGGGGAGATSTVGSSRSSPNSNKKEAVRAPSHIPRPTATAAMSLTTSKSKSRPKRTLSNHDLFLQEERQKHHEHYHQKHEPDSELWKASYEMGEYLGHQQGGQNSCFSKLYTCYDRPADQQRTVKIVMKSRWDYKDNHDNNSNNKENNGHKALQKWQSGSDCVSDDDDESVLDQSAKPSKQSHYLNHYNRNHLQEFSLLRALDHPHILKVYDLLHDDRFYYIISEYYHPQQDNLKVYLQQQQRLAEPEVRTIVHQILSCVEYLHQKQIVHCDLKLKSFVLMKNKDKTQQQQQQHNDLFLKLTDITTAVVLSPLGEEEEEEQQNNNNNSPQQKSSTMANNLRLMTPRGSARYMAPEVVAIDKSYGPKADVWSIGIITYALLSGRLPFLNHHNDDHHNEGNVENDDVGVMENYRDIQAAIVQTTQLQQQPQDEPHWLIPRFRTQEPWVSSVSDSAKHFLSRLLSPNEHDRPTATQALEHPWLKLNNNSDDDPAMPSSGLHAIQEQQQQQQQRESQWMVQQQKQATKDNLLNEHHINAISVFIAVYNKIQLEWNHLHKVLLRYVTEEGEDHHRGILTRRDIDNLYHQIFGVEMEEERMQQFLRNFGCSSSSGGGGGGGGSSEDDSMIMTELNFFVAVLSEKGLLFTHMMQDAFHVFDIKHMGLVDATYLEQILHAYLLQSTTSSDDNVVSNDEKDRVTIHAILQQVAAYSLFDTAAQGMLTVEQLVSILLEAAIPKLDNGETPLPSQRDIIVEDNESAALVEQCAPVRSLSRIQSAESAISDISQWTSIFDRLNLSLSAKDFIAQRPGLISHHYELKEFVNQGGCGAVWFCTHKETGLERAVKLVRKSPLDAAYNENIKNEFFMLRDLDHPNILRQYELYEDSYYYYIVMDAARGGDLCDELDEYGAFVEFEAARLMNQLLSCLNYLHSRGIVHCDIKPENILLEASGEISQIQLIDFGLSEDISKSENHRIVKQQGTLHYSAPEVLTCDYEAKADIWAAGVIAFLLLCDDFPFSGSSTDEIKRNIQSGKFSFSSEGWVGVSDLAKDFVAQLLTVDEFKRPSAEEALQHPWIQQVIPGLLERITPAALVTTLRNLILFTEKSKLKQAICIFIATQILSDEDKEAIDKIFHILDKEHYGSISREELQYALRKYAGIVPTQQELKSIFAHLDLSNTGFIEYSEFVLAAAGEDILLRPEYLRKAFDSFDLDGSGLLTKQNLKGILGQALTKWEGLEDEIVSEIFAQVASDVEEGIAFEKFVDLMDI